MDSSTRKDKKYYSTAQLYQLANLQNFFSPWKGPYVIIQDINDVTYRIEDPSTNKQLVVHYDRLKPFKEPPPTSNVPTRDASAKTQLQTQSQETIQEHSPIDHDQCNMSYGFVTPPTSLTPTSAKSTPSTPPVPCCISSTISWSKFRVHDPRHTNCTSSPSCNCLSTNYPQHTNCTSSPS